MNSGDWGTPRGLVPERRLEADDPKNLLLCCFSASGLVLGGVGDCRCSCPTVTTSGDGGEGLWEES